MRRILNLLLTAALFLWLSGTTLVAGSGGFTDVPADAGYAQAVAWCQEKGLMQGVSATRFDPDGTLTRSMAATVLYRAAGEPAVTGAPAFTDTQPNVWYSNAVTWANDQGIVLGYGNGLFGTNDPVTREQLDVMIRRSSGEDPAWAGDPAQNVPATRAEAAAAFYAGLNKAGEETPVQGGKVLVAYFSATGSTRQAAEYIARAAGGDLFELEPVAPYTSADLNYSNSSSRVCREHDNADLQDIELTAVAPDNWEEYDVVFIGYPIWWHEASWVVNTFVAANDFTGKTVIPFCTSASSPLEDSDEKLAAMTDTGDWLPGQRFSSGASRSTVEEWVNGLALPEPEAGFAPERSQSRALVAYFSRTGENYGVGVIEKGNTHIIADMIAQQTGAETFEIAPAVPYPQIYDECTAIAKEEKEENARPALASDLDSLDDYDVIFLGFPIWWADMPMPVYTFLKAHNWEDKTVVPFCTHGGSGLAETVSSIRSACAGAQVLDGLAVAGTAAQHDQTAAQTAVTDWLATLELDLTGPNG